VEGRVTVAAHARDLLTTADGDARTVAASDLHATIDWFGGYLVESLQATPDDARLASLLGRRASSGFRGAVSELLPDERARHSPLYLLLDDLPGALLVSGSAIVQAGIRRRPAGPILQSSDMCSGWRTGGTLVLETTRVGFVPAVTGPLAGDLLNPDDPEAWHQLPALGPHSTRRLRRLDVWRADGVLHADSFFRDSHVSEELVETSIHEYAVHAEVDPESLRVLRSEATAHALPWQECNSAPQSAVDIEGRTVGELRDWVRAEMTGIRTCTHLNDTLRSLDDVAALAELVTD